jgi:hypothetical protein
MPRLLLTTLALLLLTGCDFWRPPTPTADDYEQGLIVMYPGAYNSHAEMVGFYDGMRAAGLQHAIEVVTWSRPLESFLYPDGFCDKLHTWAQIEAVRLAEHRAEYPDAPITLLGFSNGGMPAVLVAELMPVDDVIDSVILLSPGVWRGYDLAPMLEHVTQHVMVYWSDIDQLAINLIALYGTVDGHFTEPAATFGFDTEHEKLVQIPWDPNMRGYGNRGGHLDYWFNVPWIKDYVAPWVARRTE